MNIHSKLMAVVASGKKRWLGSRGEQVNGGFTFVESF